MTTETPPMEVTLGNASSPQIRGTDFPGMVGKLNMTFSGQGSPLGWHHLPHLSWGQNCMQEWQAMAEKPAGRGQCGGGGGPGDLGPATAACTTTSPGEWPGRQVRQHPLPRAVTQLQSPCTSRTQSFNRPLGLGSPSPKTQHS